MPKSARFLLKNQSTHIQVTVPVLITGQAMAADVAREAHTANQVDTHHCVTKLMLQMRWLSGIGTDRKIEILRYQEDSKGVLEKQ